MVVVAGGRLTDLKVFAGEGRVVRQVRGHGASACAASAGGEGEGERAEDVHREPPVALPRFIYALDADVIARDGGRASAAGGGTWAGR